MRPLKPVCCLLVVVLLVGSLAFPVFAERSGIIEIRDKFMWGDPDDLMGCRGADSGWQEGNGIPDCAMIPAMPVRWARDPQVLEGSCWYMVWFGFESLLQRKSECHSHTVRVYARITRR
jgi:hypothetical protein